MLFSFNNIESLTALAHLLRVKFRPAYPGVLPRDRDTLIVAAETYAGSVAVANFDGLMFDQRKRKRPSNARTYLSSGGVGNAVQAGSAAKPEIAVQRSPTVQLAKVVTQMAF